MELKYFISIIFVTLVSGQTDEQREAVNNLFKVNKTDDGFSGLVELTSTTEGSIGAYKKCEDDDTKVCVVYHKCDPKTKTIREDSATGGFGLIDIRIGENSCDHPLDVCCGFPEDVPEPSSTSSSTTSTTEPGPGPLPTTPEPAVSFCGIRKPNGIDFKITGNKENEAEYGEFPWMVAILNNNYKPEDKDKRLLQCGGSLITPNVVLTAAHCVNGNKTTDIRIRAGEWDTQTTRERLPYQERNVINIIVHEKYDRRTLKNDFALLVLDKFVDKAENVGTICLPPQDQKIDSRNCFVSGWGKDVFGREGQYQAILKKIELPVVSRQQCSSDLRKTRLSTSFILHPSFLCAGGEVGKDACTGDGGSPLVCPDPLNNQRYVQAGIVSWGIGCGEANVPGVYANVAKFRNWIDTNMERLNIDTSPYNS